MKKNQQEKKALPRLVLSRETIQRLDQKLDETALRQAVGGVKVQSWSYCSDPICPWW